MQAFAKYRPHVQLRNPAPGESHDDHAASQRQRLKIHRQVGAAHQIQDDIYPVVVRLAPDPLRHILLARVDRYVETEFLGALQLPSRPRGTQHRDSGALRQLEGCGPHPAPDRVDQQPLAGRQTALGEQSVMGGDEDLGDGGGLGEREVLRYGHRIPLRHHDQLGVPAAAHQAHRPLTRLPELHPFAHRLHLPGILEAGDVDGPARRRRIQAPPLKQVRPVHAGCLHAYPDLARPRPAGLNRSQLQHLGATGRGDHRRLHLFHSGLPPPPSSAPKPV